VNVGNYPIEVTATFFDNAGNVVATSGEQTIAPGGVGGFSLKSQDGYCQWVVNGPKNNIRAEGVSFHHGTTGATIYPAD